MSSERRLLFLSPRITLQLHTGFGVLAKFIPYNFITLELWLLQYCCRLSKSAWSTNDKTCFTRCLNINHSLALLYLLLYFPENISWVALVVGGGFCQQVQCFSVFLAWFVYECVICSETRIWELIRDYKVAFLIGFKSRAFSNHRNVVDCKFKPTTLQFVADSRLVVGTHFKGFTFHHVSIPGESWWL